MNKQSALDEGGSTSLSEKTVASKFFTDQDWTRLFTGKLFTLVTELKVKSWQGDFKSLVINVFLRDLHKTNEPDFIFHVLAKYHGHYFHGHDYSHQGLHCQRESSDRDNYMPHID